MQFTANLMCSLPSHAGICTANLVLFEQAIKKLQTGIKLYFILHVNILILHVNILILTLYKHVPFFLGLTTHRRSCVLSSALNYVNFKCIAFTKK